MGAPSTGTVLTAEAEEACGLLMTTAAEHERSTTFAQGWFDDHSTRTRSALSYVMRLVVLVEVFTFQRAIQVSDIHAAGIASPVFEHLYKAHRKEIDRSWENALKSLNLWPAIEAKNFPEWQGGLRGYIIARNCWAHGHGRLTDRYLNNSQATTKHLGEAGFSISAQHVVVDPSQVRVVARTCRRFVERIDARSRNHL